jgi:hypothetical protein
MEERRAIGHVLRQLKVKPDENGAVEGRCFVKSSDTPASPELRGPLKLTTYSEGM